MSVTLELSYERDSRWKPHLSWSYLSWKLQQRMEEQAIQRELAWQKIADKLGPLIISSDGGLTFGGGGQGIDYTSENVEERAQERTPFYSQKLSYSTSNHSKLSTNTTNTTTHSSNATTSKLHSTTNSFTHNINIDDNNNNNNHWMMANKNSNNSNNNNNKEPDTKRHDKARRRCMTVSGILIALIFLLFTLVVLMALGILHR